MRQLRVGSIPLPEIYVVNDRKDIDLCKRNGIPYIVWKQDYELLVKLVMYPTLKELFPHIDWKGFLKLQPDVDQVLSRLKFCKPVKSPKVSEAYETDELKYDVMSAIEKREQDNNYETRMFGDASIANDYRVCDGSPGIVFEEETLQDAIGYVGDYVNLEELQKLKLIPNWIGDIATNVRKNLENYYYMEGWNKRLGYPAGNWNGSDDLPNLIILDVSGSIPKGIAATMLSLIATLREAANADLIVTGATSGWYPRNQELPTPDILRKRHGRSNESKMFNSILKRHVLNKDWGNVIAFGDFDHPVRILDIKKYSTKVHHLYSYHTRSYNSVVGYGLWCQEVCPDVQVTHNVNWVRFMKD